MTLLVELDYWNTGGAPRPVPGLPWPVGIVPVPAHPRITTALEVPEASGIKTLRLSDTGYRETPSEGGTYWAPYIVDGPDWGAAMLSGGEIASAAPLTIGSLRIADPEGALDALLDRAWVGHAVRVWLTSAGGRTPYLTAIISGLSWTEAGWQVDLGTTGRLDAVMERSTYAGTGAAAGDPGIKGRTRPLVYGYARGTHPQLVAASTLLYQVHTGACESLSVRDRGLALAAATPADYATISALLAATTGQAGSGADIEAGEYATCLAEGYFRLAAIPVGIVTADVRATLLPGHVGASTSHVVEQILRQHAPEVRVDAAAAAAVHAAVPGEMGIVVESDEVRVGALMQRLLAGIGAWPRVTPAGALEMRLVTGPDPAAAAVVHERDIEEIERVPAALPSWRRALGWRRIWRPLSEAEMADAVPAADRLVLGTGRRLLEATNANLRAAMPAARDVEMEGWLNSEADAAARVAALQEVLGVPVDVWRVAVRGRLGEWSPGATVIVHWPLWGLQDGVAMLIAAVSESAARDRTTLTLRSFGRGVTRPRRRPPPPPSADLV